MYKNKRHSNINIIIEEIIALNFDILKLRNEVNTKNSLINNKNCYILYNFILILHYLFFELEFLCSDIVFLLHGNLFAKINKTVRFLVNINNRQLKYKADNIKKDFLKIKKQYLKSESDVNSDNEFVIVQFT